MTFEHWRDTWLAPIEAHIELVIAVRGPRAHLSERHHHAMAHLDDVLAAVQGYYADPDVLSLLDPRAYQRRNAYTSPAKLALDLLRVAVPRASALSRRTEPQVAGLVALCHAATGYSAITDRGLLGYRHALGDTSPSRVPDTLRDAFEKHVAGQPYAPF
jgi:hypothetical protein